MIHFSIARDFSDTPGMRFRKQSQFSGEEFREDYLEQLYARAVKEDTSVTIDLDGLYGYPPSFLEEAFGGLARNHPKDNILSRINFSAQESKWVTDAIRKYIKEAKK